MSNIETFEGLSREIDGWLSPSELESVYEKEVDGGTFGDFAYAIQQARARDLHPLRSEVYFYTEFDEDEGEDGRVVLKLGVKIDGLRSIANRTGHYTGQKGPFWCGEDGEWKEVWLDSEPPTAAKVGILREEFDEPLWSVARWKDYAKTSKGKPIGMWKDMGAFMLAKCAESAGLRRAFPDQIGELYVPAEVDKPKSTGSEREPTEAEKKAKEITDSLGSQNGSAETINRGQVETLINIAKYEGGFTREAVNRMIEEEYGLEALEDLPQSEFTEAMEAAADTKLAERWNERVKGGEIPEDFPHREILTENGGLQTIREVHESAASGSLQDISGIGPSRAQDIRERLSESKYEAPEQDPEEKTLFD